MLEITVAGEPTLFVQQHSAVVYWRLPWLLNELNTGHADGSYRKQLLQLLKKVDLILDDWGLEKLTTRQIIRCS